MISETADCFSGFISPRKIRKDFARSINRGAAGKNHRMARIVDLTALTVITFLLTFVWTTAAFDSWAAVFAVSCAADRTLRRKLSSAWLNYTISRAKFNSRAH